MVELDQLKDSPILVLPYLAGDGEELRQRVRNLVVNHENHFEDLKDYLLSPEDQPLLNGLVTSAYAAITGDLQPVLDFEYGGLGLATEIDAGGLSFGRNRLHFAKFSETALQGARFIENSGYRSEWSGQAGQRSYVTDDAMKCSRNSDDAFMYSTFSGRSFADSVNTGRALLHGRYLGTNLLQGAVNSEELQKIVDNLARFEETRRREKKKNNRLFLPRKKDTPKGAIIPGFSQFYF